MRRSVAALRASTIEELLLPLALGKLTAEFSDSSGLRVELDVQVAHDAPLDPQHTLALFRVAQEGLTNVQRHAHAQRVTVTLHQATR